jgi:hypothetical protein
VCILDSQLRTIRRSTKDLRSNRFFEVEYRCGVFVMDWERCRCGRTARTTTIERRMHPVDDILVQHTHSSTG